MSDLSVLMSRAVRSGNVRRYRAARELLVSELGGECADCGSTDRLEFAHQGIRSWCARNTSRWVRIARYRREAYQGLVVLRCRRCNAEQGTAQRRPMRKRSREE